MMAPPFLDEPVATNATDEKLRTAGLNIDVFLSHSRQLQFDDPPLGRAVNVRGGSPRHRGTRISGNEEKRHWFRFRQDFLLPKCTVKIGQKKHFPFSILDFISVIARKSPDVHWTLNRVRFWQWQISNLKWKMENEPFGPFSTATCGGSGLRPFRLSGEIQLAALRVEI